MHLDTLEYVDELVKSGVPESQARAHANLLGKVIYDNVATKDNVKELDFKIEIVKRDIKELDVKIETTKAELKKDIKDLDVKIETTKAELKRDIKDLDVKIETVKKDIKKIDERVTKAGERLTKWIISVAGVQVTVLLAAIFGILKFLKPS